MSAEFDRARDVPPFANSTEGVAWQANWCDRCLVDAPYRNGLKGAKGCPLLLVAICGRTPVEWIAGPRDEHGRYSLANQYTCVNFRAPGGGGGEPRPKPTPKGQCELFERDGHQRRRALKPLPEDVPAPQMAPVHNVGPANNNWRGGRTVTPAGYVLIRLPDHPAADVRGYVYEHRLVMEAKLGRPLRPGERVRRKDNDPSNNDPGNLRLTSPARLDDVVACACGCGARMTRIDSAGRERRYASGHNSVRGCRQGARPKAETGSGIPKDYRLDLLDAFGGVCAYGCGRPATCWDHVIPWSDGGSFAMAGNAVPACRSCNQRKSACSGDELWGWIDRGAQFGNEEAWMDLISLAIGWGALDFPASGVEVSSGR